MSRSSPSYVTRWTPHLANVAEVVKPWTTHYVWLWVLSTRHTYLVQMEYEGYFRRLTKHVLKFSWRDHVSNSVNHKSFRPHYKDNIVYHIQYQIYHIPSIWFNIDLRLIPILWQMCGILNDKIHFLSNWHKQMFSFHLQSNQTKKEWMLWKSQR